ncbi:MAG: hypothetical protein MZV65_47735 [Chromatiales bacterium]|nr:hypothetical protein [Chromatiales bacterium]MCK7582523.1 hypothetical protein [Chromatiales bacterium]
MVGMEICFLIIPLLITFIYLINSAFYPESTKLQRDFDSWQRLMTQATILWEYLYNAFLPSAGRIGPFHDDKLVISSFNALVFVAICSWAIFIFFAFKYKI